MVKTHLKILFVYEEISQLEINTSDGVLNLHKM